MAIPQRSLVVFAPWQTSEPPRPGVVDPVSPAGRIVEETTGSPKFLENLNHPSAMFQTDAGRTACTRPLKCSSVALVHRRSKAPTKGLSTLNSMAFGLAVYASQRRLPGTTQDSLPVAGQALLDGISTRKVPMKGFKVVIYISFPSLKLTWRNRCNRGVSDTNSSWLPSPRFGERGNAVKHFQSPLPRRAANSGGEGRVRGK